MGFPVDAATIRRLAWHEAQVHAVPGRVVRDLGDGILLHDPVDPEPFWNRLAVVTWPSDPDAFAQRLAEIRVLFASIARQPHLWLLPPWDEPPDLAARLTGEGFEDVGAGCVMVVRPDAARTAVGPVLAADPGPGVRLERFGGLGWSIEAGAAASIAAVLLEAFGVDEERRAGVVAETRASLGDPRFTHYLIRLGGVPAAVCRRATFDGLSYLSSIGTVGAARGRGLARLVTAAALADAVAAGSELIHLGVFADNDPAIRLYEGLGFVFAAEPGPDMILLG